MSDALPAADIQSLFAANGANGDFLQGSKVEDLIGLCLSGGGYRAMIYHVGVLISKRMASEVMTQSFRSLRRKGATCVP